MVRLPIAKKALLPSEQVVDCGYTSSEILVEITQQYGVRIIGLVAQDPSWQPREQTGFTNGACTLDWDRKVAQCPQGKMSRKWALGIDVTGQAVIQMRFAHSDCFACAVRDQCTCAKRERRTVTVRDRVYHEALQAAQQRQGTPAFKKAYVIRAGIEIHLIRSNQSPNHHGLSPGHTSRKCGHGRHRQPVDQSDLPYIA